MVVLLLREHATPGRRWAAAGIAAALVGLGIAIRLGDGGVSAARGLAGDAGLSLVVPVIAVVFATAVLGDAAEDGSIGFLLTTPVARWRHVLAAYTATTAVVLPTTVLPVAAVLLLNAVPAGEVAATAAATAAGSLAYSAVFLALGIQVRRALVVGLVYSALWEGVIAGLGTALGRVSIRQYVTSLQASLEGQPVPDAGVTGTTAAVVLGGVVVGALAVATVLLRRHVVRD
jgi:ABC-2 type transport system permease protein